jgi:predicted S18 family serine protease
MIPSTAETAVKRIKPPFPARRYLNASFSSKDTSRIIAYQKDSMMLTRETREKAQKKENGKLVERKKEPTKYTKSTKMKTKPKNIVQIRTFSALICVIRGQLALVKS